MKRKPEPLVFISYALVTSFMTWPAASLASRTYAEARDPLGGLWSFWWMRYSLFERLPLSPMSFVAHPHGARFDLYRTDPLNSLMVRLGTALFNETVTYNLVLLLSFLTAAIACYYLVRHLTASRPAAALSGLAFAFCPYMLAQGKEHLNLVLTAWIPLFMLLLVKAWKKRTWPSAALCAASFIVLALFNFQYGLIAGVYALAFVVTLYLSGKPWSAVRPARSMVLKTAVIVGIVAAAAGLMLFSLSRSRFGSREAGQYAYSYSARPIEYVLPPAEGAFLGFATKGYITSHLHGGFLVESTLFLGYIPLALAALALAAAASGRGSRGARGADALDASPGGACSLPRERDGALGAAAVGPEETRSQASERFSEGDRSRLMLSFAVAGAAAFVMSMPPTFKLGERVIYLPSYITFKLLPQFRAYARFGVMVMFSVAVLAGWGLALVVERRRGPGRGRWAWTAAAVISLLVLVEFSLVPPFRSLDTTASRDHWRWLGGTPAGTVAAVYPMYQRDDFYNYEYLFQQRLHRRKLVNGADPGTPADVLSQSLIDIYHPATPGLLKKLGASYVVVIPPAFEEPVVHVDYPFPTRFDESALPGGLQPAARFPGGLIFEVTAPAARFVPTFTAGFYEPYVDPESRCWHPALNESLVIIESEAEGATTCDISFRAMSAVHESGVEIELNGREVMSGRLPVWPVDMALRGVSLNPGENRLVIRSDGEAAPLGDVPAYSQAVAALLTGNLMVEEVR